MLQDALGSSMQSLRQLSPITTALGSCLWSDLEQLARWFRSDHSAVVQWFKAGFCLFFFLELLISVILTVRAESLG